jgi:hypothetical protein
MRSSLALVAVAALLAGCPQERPGAQRQVPSQRVPPAVSVEPTGTDAGVLPLAAPPASDAGAPAR